MKVQFVSQASVIVECSDCRIWSDPRLHCKAFNESWGLLPPSQFDLAQLADIDYLWLSHEHPDHFHIPTLKSLPADFKDRVTVLFQDNNSNKMFDALRKLGFRTFVKLPHRKIVTLTPETRVYNMQIGNMDSSLAVLNGGKVLLNLNDCEANTRDCLLIRKDIGDVDVVLNQFSIAGYSGEEDRELHLRRLATSILENVSENHRDLNAAATIPIASFVYFCTEDNRYVNDYANRVHHVHHTLTERGQRCDVLYPNDVYVVGEPHDSRPALERYATAYTDPNLKFDKPAIVPLEQIEQAFHERVKHFRESYPRTVLRFLKPPVVRIPDLNATIRFNISADTFERLPDDVAPDVTIYSQPLHFVFRWPFGLQTLGVSARFILHKNAKNWRRHRILFSMDNAELYLRPRLLFTAKNMRWFMERLPGGVNQLRYQLSRMKPAAPQPNETSKKSRSRIA
jgi:hypothetical protein